MIRSLHPKRFVLAFFGDIADRFEDRYYNLERNLRGARMSVTYRTYMAKTLFHTVSAFILTVTLFALSIYFSPRTYVLPDIYFTSLTVGGIVVAGFVVSYAVYNFRLYYPKYVADVRARKIERSLPGVVSFMFALLQGGMSMSQTLKIVSNHSDVFGEAANEFGVASRDMEYFGVDVVTALRDLSEDTPSDEFSDFLKNFVSILIRRENMTGYLEERAKEFHEDAEQKQKKLLNTLGVLAEFYVVVFVAAPLFVITILVIMGFVQGSTLSLLRVVIYVMIPLSGFGYLVLLDTIIEGGSKRSRDYEDENENVKAFMDEIPEKEGSEESDKKKTALNVYEKWSRSIRQITSPVRTLRTKPRFALYLGVFLGLLYLGGKAYLGLFYFGYQLPTLPAVDVTTVLTFQFSEETADLIRAVDDTIFEAVMISLVFYAIFYQIRAEYLNSVENKLPDFFNRLSNINEAGVSVSQSIISLRDADLGILNSEIDKMGRDLEWNATSTQALRRFEKRVNSPAITRAVVLISNASRASGRISRVLDTAATDAETRKRLKQERRTEMMLYVIVIYLSFIIFIVIVSILNTIFIPVVPEQGIGGGSGAAGGGIGGTGGTPFKPIEYQTLFYHATIIQGFMSGLIAGKMSEGKASAGVKHSFVMMAVAYVTFTFFLQLV